MLCQKKIWTIFSQSIKKCNRMRNSIAIPDMNYICEYTIIKKCGSRANAICWPARREFYEFKMNRILLQKVSCSPLFKLMEKLIGSLHTRTSLNAH